MKPYTRTVLENSGNPEEHYLIADEVFDAGGLPQTPNPQAALSGLLCKADELSTKLGTVPIDVEPIRAYYAEDDGQVKECLVVGRGEMGALLMILLDKAFIRVAIFQNKIWPQSLWNLIGSDP